VFGRRKKIDTGAAIGDFWSWWAGSRDLIAAALDAGTVAQVADEITERVEGIHRGLEWELGAGRTASHALVVTMGGDHELRPTVARWLSAAPPADETFEYHGSRQPDDAILAARIEIAGTELDLSRLRFAYALNEDAHEVDAAVYHPAFAQLPAEAATQVTFMALDWVLGEERVELWIGAVDTLTRSSAEARSIADLRATVSDLEAKHAEPAYVLFGGADHAGAQLTATAQVPLKPARWPRFDTHVAVTLSRGGLAVDGFLDQVIAIEDAVTAALAGDGAVVAHETSANARVLHVYTDGSTAAIGRAREAAAAGPLRAALTPTYDPGFDRVAHLRP
jgi:hypothetical protein